jgi:hypothetical protein
MVRQIMVAKIEQSCSPHGGLEAEREELPDSPYILEWQAPNNLLPQVQPNLLTFLSFPIVPLVEYQASIRRKSFYAELTMPMSFITLHLFL